MPSNGNIAFGVCAETLCDRSYRMGQSLRAGLVHWHNTARLPGSPGDAILDHRIAASCQAVLQPRQQGRGSCASCGKQLVFSNLLPELGECHLCRRPYREEDLERSTCPECDAPLEIKDDLKSRLAAHKAIAEILQVVPHLKHYGYLDALAPERLG